MEVVAIALVMALVYFAIVAYTPRSWAKPWRHVEAPAGISAIAFRSQILSDEE